MKMDFLRFPPVFCQARHWWVSFHNFFFSFGLCFLLLSEPPVQKKKKIEREALLHRVCLNPFSPGSPTSGVVAFVSKGLTSAALWAFSSGKSLFSLWVAPKATAAAKGRRWAGLTLWHQGCPGCIICKIIWFLGQDTRKWWWASMLNVTKYSLFCWCAVTLTQNDYQW